MQDGADAATSDPVASPTLTASPIRAERPRRSSLRPVAEFLVILALGILLARSFAAEAYIVPTGSMAPTLLGSHRDLLCPNCGLTFPLGLDESGQAGRPICPNCGNSELESAASADGAGDRLLVQKYLFDIRPPRRWEVAVFQNPEEPGQAFVKRVVGLPGESVEIKHGDVLIDGRLARKTLEEQRAMRILVYDHDFTPRDADRYPRWIARAGGSQLDDSGWRPEGAGFVHEATDESSGSRVDWLEYRHWQPDRMAPGPVLDFVAYNGDDGADANRVDDLMFEAAVSVRPGCGSVQLRLSTWDDRLTVTLPVDVVDGLGTAEVHRDGRSISVEGISGGIESSPAESPRFQKLEASVVDRRLIVALDGRLLFDPIDLDIRRDGANPPMNLLAIGLQGEGEVQGLKVYRDVYYTSALSGGLRRPFAVGEPYRLGPGEYFVLGDNSPVSNDSRFWSGSPVVRAETFLGKPFLVHLPSQAVPLKVFGRDVYWIPDPREIRYIR